MAANWSAALPSSSLENSGTVVPVMSWYPGSIRGGATGYSQNTTKPIRLTAIIALRCSGNEGTRRQISSRPMIAVTAPWSTM